MTVSCAKTGWLVLHTFHPSAMSATTTGLQLSCANSSWRLSTSTNDYVLFTASTDVNTHTINEIQVENIDGSTTSCEMDLSWGAENEDHVIVRQIQSVSNARFVEVYDGDMNYVVTMKGVLLTDSTTRYTTDLSVINLMLNNQRLARLKFVSIKSSQLTIANLTATLLHKPVEAASKATSIPLQTSPPATHDSSFSVNGHNHHNHIVVMAQVEMMTRRFLQEMEGTSRSQTSSGHAQVGCFTVAIGQCAGCQTRRTEDSLSSDEQQ